MTEIEALIQWMCETYGYSLDKKGEVAFAGYRLIKPNDGKLHIHAIKWEESGWNLLKVEWIDDVRFHRAVLELNFESPNLFEQIDEFVHADETAESPNTKIIKIIKNKSK